MKNRFSKNLSFLVWATSLTLMINCQPQTSGDSALPLELTPSPASPVETPPLPDQQAGPNNVDNPYDPFPYEIIDNFGEATSDKLSGIVFYPPRETLFAVIDNGRIIEIKTDGTLIQKKEIRKKADFEGITYSPITEMLYVAIEGVEVILEVNPETLEAGREIPIGRIFEGNILLSPEGNGIEGITFVPGGDDAMKGSFYLVNQSKKLDGDDPSIVFEVEINYTASESQARILRYFSVGITDLSGIHYVPASRHLLIISDANNLLLEVSLTEQVLKTYEIPGKNQEGITIDGAGFLYVAQDKKKAALKFAPLDNANRTNP